MGAHSGNALARGPGLEGSEETPGGQHLPGSKEHGAAWPGCPKPKLTLSSSAFSSCSAWGCGSLGSCGRNRNGTVPLARPCLLPRRRHGRTKLLPSTLWATARQISGLGAG